MRHAVLAAALAVVAAAPALAPAADAGAPLETRHLRCAGPDAAAGAPDAVPILENQVDRGFRCWGHFGTHTYFAGNDSVLAFRGGHGNVFPVEVGTTGQGAFVSVVPPLEPGVVVELSLDGLAWKRLHVIPVPSRPQYTAEALERLTGEDLPTLPSAILFDARPFITFTLPDTGDAFRFLRFRLPKSADGGLTGYLDGSELRANVTRLGPAPAPALESAFSEYDCGAHILEDVFEEHPCSFGSTASYFDSPSATHTYWLGGVERLRTIGGHATFHPYRSIATAQHGKVAVTAFVETSRDGRDDWVERGSFAAIYGVPTAFVATDLDAEAQFVRLRTEPHRLTASGGTHHWAGFLASSTLLVDGLVAPHARGDGPWSDVAWTLNDRATTAP